MIKQSFQKMTIYHYIVVFIFLSVSQQQQFTISYIIIIKQQIQTISQLFIRKMLANTQVKSSKQSSNPQQQLPNTILPLPQSFPFNSELTLNQLAWLSSKKENHIKQLKQLEQKQKDKIQKIIQYIHVIQQDKKQFQIQLDAVNKNCILKQNLHSSSINKFQSIINSVKKENYDVKQQNAQKSKKIIQLQDNINKNQQERSQLLTKISQLEQQLQKKSSQHSQTLHETLQKNSNNIQQIIKKYQNLIEQKVSQIQRKYKQQLDIIKKTNKNYVEELQIKSKNNIEYAKNQGKKNIQDTERLLGDNKRLLSHINQSKKKILSLQNELQTQKQDQKMVLKQKQLQIQNCKRQIQILHENKIQLIQNNKKIKQINQNYQWDLKQIQIQRVNQLKKIKQTSQNMLDQIVAAYKVQLTQFKQNMNKIKMENQELKNKCQEIKRQRDSAKQVVQYVKKQKQNLVYEKQKQHKQKQYGQINQQMDVGYKKNHIAELKKDIVKKMSEIEVLKQQVSRLKNKINKITVAYQQNIKTQQIVQKQNKMLLSQIIYLRDKNKNIKYDTIKKNNKQNNSKIFDIKSQKSIQLNNDHYQQINNQQLDMYKILIKQMEKDMNQAVLKLDQKNHIIQKQKDIIQRLQKALNK